jgi:Kef-type K+ transport system membrane component KefB
MGAKWPHHIRIPIFSLAFCFLWAYLAQQVFNIADITGAYVAGLILSATNSEQYIDHRADVTSNLFFTPIFFASVALKMYTANLDFSDMKFLWFGLCWVLVGALGKIIGAGSGALMCRFNFKDSLRIGIGMMARAEVLIVCAQTGVDTKIKAADGSDITLVSQEIIPFTLLLILLTSFLTPIFLKLAFKGELDEDVKPALKVAAGPAADSQPAGTSSAPADSQIKK